MTRGALAAGTVRTYVLHDRITRASCFVCARRRRRGRARTLDRGRAAGDARVARLVRRPVALEARELREVKTHVVGPMCHVLWAWTTGDAVGPNMMTRNSYALNMALRDAARAGQAGARDPRGEHGRRQEAVARVLPVRAREDGARRGVPPRRADPARAAHDRRGSRGALVGRHARRGRLRDAVGRVHAGDGDRGGLRGDRPGPRHGRHELDGPRHRAAASRAASRRRSASAGSRSAPSAAARRSPRPATGSRSIGCAGRGKVYRFAQIVAAAALCLEISASAAMATAGSENFFKAHHERGGLR